MSASLPIPAYKAHLFICTHTRGKDASCGGQGSAELRDAVKKSCKELGKTRVNTSGCLGHCERGIVAVLYSSDATQGPQWFLNLKSNDSEVLCEAMKKTVAGL